MLDQYLTFRSITNSADIFSGMSRRRFGVLDFRLTYDFRLQSLGYRLYVKVELVTMFTEDCCIWDSEYVENTSQRTAASSAEDTLIWSFESLLHICYRWQYSAEHCLFLFLPFLSSFFFFFFFLWCSLLMLTRFQFYLPFVVTRMLESLAGCRTMFLFAISCKVCVLERKAYWFHV